MLNVSDKTKELFKSDSIHKEMEVKIYAYGGPYVFDNSLIYSESFELNETALDGSNMAFMGCIASEMKITVRNVDNLRENAFNKSKITVKTTPYENVPTKNKLRPIYGAGETFTKNGLSCTINSDLSIHIDGWATEDTYITYSEFIGMGEDIMWLSGCPSFIGSNNIKGVLTILKEDGTVTTLEDTGSEVVVSWEVGDTCNYSIFIAEGTGITDTFYPMLRGMQESSEYEPYGTLPVAADTVPLFSGYVDHGEYDMDKSYLKLTCYDVLYFINNYNVWNWYRKAFDNGALTMSALLDSFANEVNSYSGYEFELSTRCPVILSAVKVKRRLKNKDMTATNFLKAFCQLSCCCAMIDREGKLRLIYRDVENTKIELLEYYRGLTAKDYVVKPFAEGITIRTNSEDNGVTLTTPDGSSADWDSDTNDNYIIDDDDVDVTMGKYVIENNGLVKKLSKQKRKAIMNIVLNKVAGSDGSLSNRYYAFKSYNLECNGIPYVECGDDIKCIGEASPEEHINEPFSSSKLPIDNSDGIEVPISFEITFTAMYVPLNNYQAYMGSPICMGSAGYDDHLQRPPYFGIDVGKCLQLIGKTNASDTIIGDKIVLSNYNGASVMVYKSLENGGFVEYDVSSCMFSYTTEGQTVYCDHDLCIPADSEITFDKYTYGGPFDTTITVTYSLILKQVKLQAAVMNRRLSGIQAMKDTFSFNIPENQAEYGGTTSGFEDSNIASSDNDNTAGQQLSGKSVLVVVSFENGILTTKSEQIT